jgi:Flp pilus assembly protein TadG
VFGFPTFPTAEETTSTGLVPAFVPARALDEGKAEMLLHTTRRRPALAARRPGAAAVEMALLLPILSFLCVIAVDFARIFYFSVTVENCARNGALYQSDPYAPAESQYPTVTAAALADASNLNDPSNPPTVSTASGSDSSGPYIEVTVAYTFQTITNFPGVPATLTLRRTVRMAVEPLNPTK